MEGFRSSIEIVIERYFKIMTSQSTSQIFCSMKAIIISVSIIFKFAFISIAASTLNWFGFDRFLFCCITSKWLLQGFRKGMGFQVIEQKPEGSYFVFRAFLIIGDNYEGQTKEC